MYGISLMRVAAEIEEQMTQCFSSLPVKKKLCSTDTATCETQTKTPDTITEECENGYLVKHIMLDFSSMGKDFSPLKETAL